MKSDDCCLFVRARKPEQVAQRRESILVAMANLLREVKPEQISLNEVARRAGLAKSNLYRYFDSREAIFLELLKEDSLRWIDHVENVLRQCDDSNDITATAAAIAQVTAAETRMCQLLSQISGVLEQDISSDVVSTFRQHSIGVLDRFAQAVHKTLPDLLHYELSHAIQYVVALVVGLWPQTHLTRSLLIQPPSLSVAKQNFEEEFKKGLMLIFYGLANQSKQQQPI